ncbi:serine palmitoyltransferase small subunit B isoform X3 [Anser cygnoides]|uniref:serine palmitoyltransferase small subunit B isoform X3 n=1 Tax=Anser cygnoides TaxID=8845 RepID=UPI0034D15918
MPHPRRNTPNPKCQRQPGERSAAIALLGGRGCTCIKLPGELAEGEHAGLAPGALGALGAGRGMSAGNPSCSPSGPARRHSHLPPRAGSTSSAPPPPVPSLRRAPRSAAPPQPQCELRSRPAAPHPTASHRIPPHPIPLHPAAPHPTTSHPIPPHRTASPRIPPHPPAPHGPRSSAPAPRLAAGGLPRGWAADAARSRAAGGGALTRGPRPAPGPARRGGAVRSKGGEVRSRGGGDLRAEGAGARSGEERSAHRQRPAQPRGAGPGTAGGREPGACSAQRRLERKGLVNQTSAYVKSMGSSQSCVSIKGDKTGALEKPGWTV